MKESGKRSLESDFSQLRLDSEGSGTVSSLSFPGPSQQLFEASSLTPAPLPQIAGLKTVIAALRELIGKLQPDLSKARRVRSWTQWLF